MNSTKRNVLQEYKQCAGKGCRQKANTILEIKYLYKTGYFCDNCAKDLLELGLAYRGASINHSSKNDLALVESEEPLANSKGNEPSFQEGPQNDYK